MRRKKRPIFALIFSLSSKYRWWNAESTLTWTQFRTSLHSSHIPTWFRLRRSTVKAKLTFPISILVGYFRDSPGPTFLRALMGQKDDCGVQEEDGGQGHNLGLKWQLGAGLRHTNNNNNPRILSSTPSGKYHLINAAKINSSTLEPLTNRRPTR